MIVRCWTPIWTGWRRVRWEENPTTKTTMGGRRNWEGGCGGPWEAVTSVVGLRRRPLDDGAEVVGICLLPWRSMHISDRGGGLSSTTKATDCWREGSGGANLHRRRRQRQARRGRQRQRGRRGGGRSYMVMQRRCSTLVFVLDINFISAILGQNAKGACYVTLLKYVAISWCFKRIKKLPICQNPSSLMLQIIHLSLFCPQKDIKSTTYWLSSPPY